MEAQLENTPRVSGGLLGARRVLESQGLPNNFVIGRSVGLRNAIFSGASSPKIIKTVAGYSPDLSGKMTKEDVDNASRNGMILFDPDYARAGVIAHEGGHAKIHADGGIGRVNQSYFRPVGGAVSAFSPLIGSAAGYATASPLIGGLVGGLSGAIGSLPTIINEAQATGHAREYLDKSKHRINTKQNNNKALSHAYFSYLAPAVISALGGAASGAIGGQIGKMEKGAKYSDDDDDQGDKPIVPKPVVPGLGLAGAGLGVAGLGGLMVAPSAIDSINRFNSINPSNNPIKSLDTYTGDGGNLLRSKLYNAGTGFDLVHWARKHLPAEVSIPFTNTKIPLLGQWAKWGPHEDQHYGSFVNGQISAEMQLMKELSQVNPEIHRPEIELVMNQFETKAKEITGKTISQMTPQEQQDALPKIRAAINSIPVIGKINQEMEQRVGEDIQGVPGYEGKGHIYNSMVVNPLNNLRKGLMYAGAGLAAGGGAYALYKYMQYRKQKAEQQKQQAASLVAANKIASPALQHPLPVRPETPLAPEYSSPAPLPNGSPTPSSPEISNKLMRHPINGPLNSKVLNFNKKPGDTIHRGDRIATVLSNGVETPVQAQTNGIMQGAIVGKGGIIGNRPISSGSNPLLPIDYSNPASSQAGLLAKQGLLRLDRTNLQKSADVDNSAYGKFAPDYTPEQLKEMGVYREVYGKKDGPRLASLESWPAHWYHPEDKMGWLEWYKKYSNGRRMEDDARQINRWAAFKARHGGPAFQENPTPRRAYALRNWGIDATKLVRDPKALSQAMELYREKTYKKFEDPKTAGLESFAKTIAQYEANTGHIKQQLNLLRNGAEALQKRTHFLVPHEIESAAHGLPSSAQHLSELKNYIAGRIGELAQNPYVKGLGEELHGIVSHFGIK
jgi:biotin carboxyl carrier protein